MIDETHITPLTGLKHVYPPLMLPISRP